MYRSSNLAVRRQRARMVETSDGTLSELTGL